MRAAGIRAEVGGRTKGAYSIWRKMQRRATPFEELSDIVAFRIVVPDMGDCYAALGVLHASYPIVPGRFKDYISLPKANGYRSLHTEIIGPGGRRVEVQVRDHEMHRFAEYGLAAHWRYKESGKGGKAGKSGKTGKPGAWAKSKTGGRAGKSGKSGKSEGKAEQAGIEGAAGAAGTAGPEGAPGASPYQGRNLAWVKDFLEILNEAQSPEEFLEHTKLEMYSDRVFCFTPRGKLIILPRGACAVDFAYAIHSEVGHRCSGARINGRLMPLRTPLENGDQVEVVLAKEAHPSPDWENLVVTAKARASIRRYLRQTRRGEFVRLGKALLERHFRQGHYAINEAALEAVLGRWNLASLEDLYAQIGEDRLSPVVVRNAVHPEARGAPPPPSSPAAPSAKKRREAEAKNPLAIRGLIPGMAVHFARCCHPIPGDRIVGIVITGRGVAVHTLDCDNLAAYHETPERWVELSWNEERDPESALAGRLRVTVLNRPGGLGALCTTIAGGQSNIINLKITGRSRDFFDIMVDVEVRDTEHLASIIAALRGNADVCSVDRAKG